MVQIVPCHHLDHVVDAFIAALRVDTVVIPELSRNRFQQGNVGFTQSAEIRQRLPRIAPSIVKRFRPQVLIIGLDGNGIVCQNLAEPPAR